jgi:hypothetical protein
MKVIGNLREYIKNAGLMMMLSFQDVDNKKRTEKNI